jgi:hypothetical protein
MYGRFIDDRLEVAFQLIRQRKCLVMTTYNFHPPSLLKWEFFSRCKLPKSMPMSALLLH